MVEAKVPSGGRGKAGGIVRANTLGEVEAAVRMLIGREIAGHEVGTCRVEAAVLGGHEAYIGFSLHAREAAMSVLLSPVGGVDVERDGDPGGALDSPRCRPDLAEMRWAVDSLSASLPSPMAGPVRVAGRMLAGVACAFQALLREVDPLFILPSGGRLAGDARIVLDDNVIGDIPRTDPGQVPGAGGRLHGRRLPMGEHRRPRRGGRSRRARATCASGPPLGRRIGDFQGMRWKLADMYREIEAARGLFLRARAGADPYPDPVAAALAKIACNEMSIRVTSEAVQIHGGYGFVDEFPVSRYFRCARYGLLGGGTSEALRNLVGRHLVEAFDPAVGISSVGATGFSGP
jgi:hypothetical protein